MKGRNPGGQGAGRTLQPDEEPSIATGADKGHPNLRFVRSHSRRGLTGATPNADLPRLRAQWRRVLTPAPEIARQESRRREPPSLRCSGPGTVRAVLCIRARSRQRSCHATAASDCVRFSRRAQHIGAFTMSHHEGWERSPALRECQEADVATQRPST